MFVPVESFLHFLLLVRKVRSIPGVELQGQNDIKILQYFFMVNYHGKKTLLFLGLKYRSNTLSYCSNLQSFQGKFDVINIPMGI